MAFKVMLNNGVECPVLGFGTAKCLGEDGYQAVTRAIDAGYRHIDCAHLYRNEEEIGKAIAEKIEDGTVKRTDLFITGKLWNSFLRKNMVRPALERTLVDLGLEYIDLYLIHWPMAFKDGWDLNPRDAEGKIPYSDAEFTETWEAMEELVNEGLIRSIGVSNFNKEQIERILGIAEIKPVINQVECHPYLNQTKLLDFCKSKDIALAGYRVIGMGDSGTTAIDDPLVKKLAEKYDKVPAQILIRFQMQRNVIAIVKSTNAERIRCNFDVFDFEIDANDMESLLLLDKGKNGRQIVVPNASDHKNYPFHSEF